MAIQAAKVYSENYIGLGLGFSGSGSGGGGGGGDLSQDLIMDNACCGVGVNGFNQFYFNIQQQQQKQQQQQIQHQQQRNQNQNQNQNQNLCFDNSNNSSYNQSMPFSQSIAFQAEKQRQEIDCYIRQQNERLRMVLQEQRKQQLEMLLKKVEIKTSALMRQKDEEIAKAKNRTMELEILLKKLEMESQAWQRMAQENEAMVVSLNITLEQMKENACCCFGAEDAESFCDCDVEEEQQQRRTRKMVMVCRGCNSSDSCILFLPCRHLCSCKACETFLDSCPLCLTPKKASIEALIF